MPFMCSSLSCLAFEILTCDHFLPAFAEVVGRIRLRFKDRPLLEMVSHLL